MALIAARTKISRTLSTFSLNSLLSRPPFPSNGVQAVARLHPFGGLGSSFSSSAVASMEPETLGSRGIGFEILGVKDYEDYRRSLYGDITHKALLVDAVGTLVVPSQPMAQVSLSFYLFKVSIRLISFFLFFFVCVKWLRTYNVFLSQIYREIGEKYGVNYSEGEILNRYRRAYEKPWGRSRLRSTFFDFRFIMINFSFIILNVVVWIS